MTISVIDIYDPEANDDGTVTGPAVSLFVKVRTDRPVEKTSVHVSAYRAVTNKLPQLEVGQGNNGPVTLDTTATLPVPVVVNVTQRGYIHFVGSAINGTTQSNTDSTDIWVY